MGRVITAPGVLTNVQGQIDHVTDMYDDIKDNNLKPLTITLDAVSNANGSYSHITEDERITEDMKPIALEVGTPESFYAPVTVTTGDVTATVSCPDAHGNSTITVTFIKTSPVEGGEDYPPAVTSTEFDILADRIGALSSLTTTDKTDLVSAVNEVKSTAAQDDANIQDALAIVANGNTHGAITSGQFVYVKNHGTLADGLYKAKAAISANATLSTTNLEADNSGGLNNLLASTNEAIAKVGTTKYLGSFSTTSALATALDTELASMSDNSMLAVYFTFSATVSPFMNTVVYSAMIYKIGSSTTYSHMMAYPNSQSKPITGWRTPTGWSYEYIGLNKSITNLAPGWISYSEGVTNITKSVPVWSATAMYKVVFRIYTSATTSHFIEGIIYGGSNNSIGWDQTASTTSVTVTNVSINGTNVTFTFSTSVYVSGSITPLIGSELIL